MGAFMFKLASVIFLLFSFANCPQPVKQPASSGATNRNEPSGTKSIPSLSYCDLIKSHSSYDGKPVRLKASWRFGFETSFLNSRECSEQPKAWLEFVDDKDACSQSKKNRNTVGQNDKEADVTVVGKLYGPGNYGHLGAYEYKFVVTCMENLKVTDYDNTEK